jgi:ubiquinone/menaquinone biosynthesis C-methylase UbiE
VAPRSWNQHCELASGEIDTSRHDGVEMTAEGWEREAENWIAWTRTPGHDAYHLYRDAFFELLPAPGAATLEVGCGEGRVAGDLAALGHRVTAVDAAPSLIRAAQLAHPEGTYLVGDVAKLPFPDRSFELVVAYNSLMNIAAMPTAVSEAARALAPEGRLRVCVTHPVADVGEFADQSAQSPFVITGSYLEDHVPPYAGRPVERDRLRLTFHSLRYSLEQYARALETAGL